MTPTQRCARAKHLLQFWANKQGHDRCWFFPEIFGNLAALFDVTIPTPELPPRPQFEAGCKRYQDEQYGEVAESE